MDFTQTVLWVLSIAYVVFGWFARQVWASIKDLRDDVGKMDLNMATNYVRYDRLQDALKPVMDSLHEIKMTLAGKADK